MLSVWLNIHWCIGYRKVQFLLASMELLVHLHSDQLKDHLCTSVLFRPMSKLLSNKHVPLCQQGFCPSKLCHIHIHPNLWDPMNSAVTNNIDHSPFHNP